MKKFITIFALLMATTNIFAQSFMQDDIVYSVTSSEGPMTVSVIGVTDSYRDSFYIPSTVTNEGKTYSVNEIASHAFMGCNMTSVTFEKDSKITTIGDEAFYTCSLLREITIPESVTSIGSRAFEMCDGLKSVTFEGSACQNNIADNAFSNPAVKMTKGDDTIILYGPDKVEFIKAETEK